VVVRDLFPDPPPCITWLAAKAWSGLGFVLQRSSYHSLKENLGDDLCCQAIPGLVLWRKKGPGTIAGGKSWGA
jgi:hypothetical protein